MKEVDTSAKHDFQNLLQRCEGIMHFLLCEKDVDVQQLDKDMQDTLLKIQKLWQHQIKLK